MDEDELAQGMEDAIEELVHRGKRGQHYVLRNDHGVLKAGTVCRVYRTASMSIATIANPDEVQKELLGRDLRSSKQTIGNLAGGEQVVYNNDIWGWILLGLETEDELREKLKAYRDTRKRKPKIHDKLEPF